MIYATESSSCIWCPKQVYFYPWGIMFCAHTVWLSSACSWWSSSFDWESTGWRTERKWCWGHEVYLSNALLCSRNFETELGSHKCSNRLYFDSFPVSLVLTQTANICEVTGRLWQCEPFSRCYKFSSLSYLWPTPKAAWWGGLLKKHFKQPQHRLKKMTLVIFQKPKLCVRQSDFSNREL